MAVGATGGAFGAGFIGSSAALTATTSFVTGAAIGCGAGFSAGFTTGFGNDLLGGQKFGDALFSGIYNGLKGGLSGAVLGGLVDGFKTMKNNYKVYDGLDLQGPEYSEQQVESEFKNLTGFGEGEYNISDVTTSAPSGDFVNSDKLFVDGNRYYYGAVKQSFWTGKIDVHISPYATRDIVFMRGVITHEFQHVWQINKGIISAAPFRGYNLLTKHEMERNAYVHEIMYLLSLPASMYSKHNIGQMIANCAKWL